MPNEYSEWISIPEAARRLGVSERTMNRLLDAGKIEWSRPSKHRRVNALSLEAYQLSVMHRQQTHGRRLPRMPYDPLA